MPKGKKSSRKKLTALEKEQKTQKSEVRKVLRQAGFRRIPEVTDKEFTFRGVTSDLDDVFVYENVFILAEYTCTSKEIGHHLKKKKILFDKINEQKIDFLKFLQEKFSSFEELRNSNHYLSQCAVKIVYVSRYQLNQKDMAIVEGVTYLEYPTLKYFIYVTTAIRLSSRFELFDFLGLKTNEIQNTAGTGMAGSNHDFKGSILPEEHSNFGEGFKVVSFYANPASLLERCYVMRRQSWRDYDGLYQRMILSTNINKIRLYLKKEKRVFVNNIIVTLPNDTKILDDEGKTVDASKIHKTAPVNIQLPAEFNSVGIVDGQHRVFSYHEGGSYDGEIAKLRYQQNLLVTGIIYPPNISSAKRTKFEAQQFKEINSTQVKVKSDLLLEIGLLLTPYSLLSAAKRIVENLNSHGALENQFISRFFDKNKVKTTSIIKFGLAQLIKLNGKDSLFYVWNEAEKEDLHDEKNEQLFNAYVNFCFEELNKFLVAIKKVNPSDKWTADTEVKDRLLSTTNINGFIFCLKYIVEYKKLKSIEYYESKLSNLSSFKFGNYHSSQYRRLGRDLFNKYFAETSDEKIVD